ncbi:Na+/H+ antiporter [Sphingobacterium sp. UGAL515B_05]|uniref:Na+/H+ antiporter n=1 Tax=Sphingobacterium sp. UGAL515B_05 TaxID=2986767 RepID=UPI00295351C0|nr:Na+/H+ antiporter [Sphingobacterium sp. UGAL515B_05]WON92243.1 Na+/H+ antiporter [Sphingobacterium sp. UGAL515B_05]
MIRKIILGTYCFLSLILFVFPTSAQQPMDEINGLLDRWHKTSGEVKYGPFLNVIASDGVILGTDHDERWDKTHAEKFSDQYFNPKNAWTYTYDKRHISFNGDSTTAWFDETFKINTKSFRGVGVLTKLDNEWKLRQYSISMSAPYADVKAAVGGKAGQKIHSNLLLVMVLFFFMAMLFVLSQRLKISYPILLVIGGLVISLIPGAPVISVDPDIVFMVFLPPLLFEAAWYTNWGNFLKWRRSIFIMGFGLVFFTSLAIAYFSVSIIPGFTLALGFLLGGIISPPDAVAASSVLKGVSIPKRGIAILEGESLVNDAASLTVFRFASIAILTGQFVMSTATTQFLMLSVMGVVVGLVIGHILYIFLRYVAKSSSISTPITLIAPYLMYIVAEHFEWSGVLAVVSGGLFLSFRAGDYLNYHTRIQTKEVWATVGFLLNGFVFILIGLELPVIINGLGEYSMEEAIDYALAICVIVIVLRLIAVYLSAFVPRILFKRVRIKEKSPGWKLPLVVGWAGMRGVVSLASALAIPLTLYDGTAFPHRNLILFITFVVILVTLVFQGLTLPLLIKLIKIEEVDEQASMEEQIDEIRVRLGKESIAYLDKHYAKEMLEHETIARVKEQIIRSVNASERAKEEDTRAQLSAVRGLYNKIMLELLALRRDGLYKIKESKAFDSDVIKEIEYSLDLEESRLSRK